MGLRDALKAKVKGLLGVASPGPTPVVPAPAAVKIAPISPEISAKPAVSPNPEVSPTDAANTESSPTAPADALPSEPEATAKSPPPTGLSWHIVAPAGKVTEDKPGTYAHGRYNVSVFRHQGKLYAMDDACAHEDGPLGEGALDGNCVVCPYHDWRYEFTTGKCLTEPDRARATFAVKEEAGQLWLGERLTHGSDSRGGDHDDGMEVIRK